MISRDYTKELGLKPTAPKVPMPVALAILAVFGGAVWFGVARMQTVPVKHSPQEASTAKPAAAGHHGQQ